MVVSANMLLSPCGAMETPCTWLEMNVVDPCVVNSPSFANSHLNPFIEKCRNSKCCSKSLDYTCHLEKEKPVSFIVTKDAFCLVVARSERPTYPISGDMRQ